MPTATKYFDFGVTNAGPLTTTWTAPAACSTTKAGWYVLASADGNGVGGKVDCNIGKGWGDCIPSGSKLDAEATKSPSFEGLVFYSPGLHCPAGWTTAGTVVGASDGVTSASGVFTESPTYTMTGRPTLLNHPPGFLNKVQAFEGVLDASETLAWCCPSGFSASIGAECISTIGPATDHDISTVCALEVLATPAAVVTSFDGTIYTQGLNSFAATAASTSTLHRAVTSLGDQSLVTILAAVALIHKQSDMDSKDGGKDDDKGGDKSGDKGDDKDSGATRSGFGTPSLTPVMAVAAGILAGAGFILPW